MKSRQHTVDRSAQSGGLQLPNQFLIAALVSSGLAHFLGGAEFSLQSLVGSFITVGGPTILGEIIVQGIDPAKPTTAGERIVKAGFAGAAAVGLMIMSGALPALVDGQTASMVGLVGAGVFVGESFGSQ